MLIYIYSTERERKRERERPADTCTFGNLKYVHKYQEQSTTCMHITIHCQLWINSEKVGPYLRIKWISIKTGMLSSCLYHMHVYLLMNSLKQPPTIWHEYKRAYTSKGTKANPNRCSLAETWRGSQNTNLPIVQVHLWTWPTHRRESFGILVPSPLTCLICDGFGLVLWTPQKVLVMLLTSRQLRF